MTLVEHLLRRQADRLPQREPVAPAAAPGSGAVLVDDPRQPPLTDLGHRAVGDDGGVLVVGGRFDDGPGAQRRVVALEDARTDEHRLRAELQDQRGVGRRGDATGTEQRDRQLAGFG